MIFYEQNRKIKKSDEENEILRPRCQYKSVLSRHGYEQTKNFLLLKSKQHLEMGAKYKQHY